MLFLYRAGGFMYSAPEQAPAQASKHTHTALISQDAK